MKKTYICPTINIVKVNLTKIIAVSTVGLQDSLNGTDQNIVDNSSLTKQHTLWDEVW